MPSMARPPWLLLCLLYSLAVWFAGVRARVASVEPSPESPLITEAPQAALGRLRKRDSPICGYFDGIVESSLTCNAPNDCYIFTDAFGFYSAKGACGQRAITSYNGPWGLCVNYGGGLCPDVASCSAAYTSVLFCPPAYPYCVRFEMRDTPSDPFYYVLLDCTTAYYSTALQILFTPTTTASPIGGQTTPAQAPPSTVNRTPAAPSSTPTTPTSTSPPTPTTDSPNPTPTPTNTEPSPTTNSSPNQTPVTISNPSPSSSQDPSSGSASSGLTVGDKAGIAGAIVGAVAIFTGIISVAFPHETRTCLSYFFCCYCCRSTGPA